MHTLKNLTFGKNSRGFALIATLSLMILIAIISIGLLTLSSVTLRTANADKDLATARANARLALMMAIGQLQKAAGADQRVTADASILEEPKVDASPLANRNWTGVWRTDGLKNDPIPNVGEKKGLLYRQTGAMQRGVGSLVDIRGSSSYARQDEVEWLVSNPFTKSLAANVELSGSDSVTLVGAGSAARAQDFVKVLKVGISDARADKALSGHYGYWVSDQNQKANIRAGVREATNSTSFSDQQQFSDISRMNLNGLQTNVASGAGKDTLEQTKDISDEQIRKVITRNTFNLLITQNEREQIKSNYHDITSFSQGLLVDTMRGGLRRDLSAFLREGKLSARGSDVLAIQESTPILDSLYLNRISPKFGILKSWFDLSKLVDGNSIAAQLPMIAPKVSKIYGGGSGGSFTGQITDGIDLKNNVKAGLHPVLTEFTLSFGIGILRAPGATTDANGYSEYKVYLLVYPRVVLWNPYDVDLKVENYAVQMFGPSFGVLNTQNLTRNPGNPNDYFEMNIGSDIYTGSKRENDDLNNLLHRGVYSLPKVALKAGQAQLFTANPTYKKLPSKVQPWPLDRTDGNKAVALENYQLSASMTPPLTSCFAIEFNPPGARWFAKAQDIADDRVTGTFTAYAPAYDRTNFAKLWKVTGNPTTAQLSKGEAGEPLQSLCESENGGGFTNAPFNQPGSYPGESRQIYLLDKPEKDGNRIASYRFKNGMRVQWMNEINEHYTKPSPYDMEYMGFNLIANYNLRNDWSFPCAIDAKYRASGASGRYNLSPFVDDTYGFDWNAPYAQPVPSKDAVGGNVNQVSPFGQAQQMGNMLYPLFSVPRKEDGITSIAAFQHAPLSIFAWDTSYAVGNSFANPRVPRDLSTNYIVLTGRDNSWPVVGSHSSYSTWKPFFQGLDDGQPQALIFDTSYEYNDALWDRFFLSGLQASANVDSAMLNSRLVMNLGAKSEALQDGNLVARELKLEGAFNVNSTSEQAWFTMLSSFRTKKGKSVQSTTGQQIGMDELAFTRLLRPYALKKTSDGAATSDAVWEGYQSISDAQLRILAKNIVIEVKARGPFLSLSDFVNRRLNRLAQGRTSDPADDDLSTLSKEDRSGIFALKGALQSAIDRSSRMGGMNQAFNKKDSANAPYQIAKTEYTFHPNEGAPMYTGKAPAPSPFDTKMYWIGLKMDHNLYADTKLVGAPSYITQADVLQKIGGVLAARGDTFVIRVYGDACSSDGTKVLARAYAEATVQRVIEPLSPDSSFPEKVASSKQAQTFGRRFQVVSFRWMHPSEI